MKGCPCAGAGEEVKGVAFRRPAFRRLPLTSSEAPKDGKKGCGTLVLQPCDCKKNIFSRCPLGTVSQGGGIEFLIFHFFASLSRFTTFYSNYNVLQRIKRDAIKRGKTLQRGRRATAHRLPLPPTSRYIAFYNGKSIVRGHKKRMRKNCCKLL